MGIPMGTVEIPNTRDHGEDGDPHGDRGDPQKELCLKMWTHRNFRLNSKSPVQVKFSLKLKVFSTGEKDFVRTQKTQVSSTKQKS